MVGNAFSTPIELPRGSEKSAVLNIQARSFPDRIRVELIDADGAVRAAQDAGLNHISPQDQLYAVVIGPNTAPPNLSGVHIGGFKAEQAIWRVGNIPENGAALESLDLMLLINIDSESMSSGQRRAVQLWVEGGGHLIVSGGPSANITASGLQDLLPLAPADSRSIDNLSALARFSGDNRASLDRRTVIALGTAHDDAITLAAQDGIPLLLRRELGAGVVDYLAADPTLEPLAGWNGLNGLWFKLLATRSPHPIWREGFRQPNRGADAIANLPGVNLLPPLQTLCIFLTAYIVLIGPLNYLILSRLRRNGWGWLTIPVVIICFTGVAWTVGFNLRGAEIIVSRATLVESYTTSDEAQVSQFVGLLSPRRATYSLSAPDGHYLAVASATNPVSLFASNTIQTGTEIAQASTFSANDFTIDGGIFANFTIGGHIARPAINGSFTLDFAPTDTGRMVGAFQGFISNESDITLRDAVLMGAGLRFPLENDLAPGDILTLSRDELRPVIANTAAQPNPLELSVPTDSRSTPYAGSGRNSSIRGLQGERYLRSRIFLNPEAVADQQAAREQSFLASFMIDRFLSTARGSKLYLLGWDDYWAHDLDIDGAAWSAIDSTLYIIELDVDIQLPNQRATLPTEYFSWISLDRQGLTDNGTDNFSMYEGQAAEFLFHPLPGLAMETVDRLFIEVDRGGGYAQTLDTELFNWHTNKFDVFNYQDGEELEFTDPASYLGPGNAVRIRLQYEQGVGTARVREIRIEQTGRYS